MKSTLIVTTAVCVGFVFGHIMGGIIPFVVTAETQQYLESRLVTRHPDLAQEDIEQGRHVATYAYASLPKVIKWYYRTDWEYAD